MRIEGIQPGGIGDGLEYVNKVAIRKDVPSFKDTLASFVKDVNESQNVAGDAQKKFLAEIGRAHV